jgi:hypothetical protein
VWFPVRHFVTKLSPKGAVREVKYFVQRGQRGWSDRDWWSTDYYLLKILPPILRKYATDGVSYPGTVDYDTPEKWSAALLKAADDIEAYFIYDEHRNFPKTKKAQYKYHEENRKAQARTTAGMQFVVDNFLSLWD